MVKLKKLEIVFIILSFLSLALLHYIGTEKITAITPNEAEKEDIAQFIGLCVYSKGDFSVLYNGTETIIIHKGLEPNKVYKVMGKTIESSKSTIDVFEVIEVSPELLPLETLNGTFWKGSACYLLLPERIKLNKCLNVSKGEIVKVDGLFYGKKFYVVRYAQEGFPKRPENNMPFVIKGVVLDNRNPSTIWNGSEEIKVYLPYKTELKIGDIVEITGIAKLYSTLTLYVEDNSDIKFLGKPNITEIGKENIGDIAYGVCQVTKSTRYLKLNCTSLKLYGFSAKLGDIVEFKAIRRKNSLYCIECRVKIPREKLSNSICQPLPNIPSKIHGRVSWIKTYANGFSIANITNGKCWILLKLPKSLGVSLHENLTITAFGFHSTYRGRPAFEIPSGDELCLEKYS